MIRSRALTNAAWTGSKSAPAMLSLMSPNGSLMSQNGTPDATSPSETASIPSGELWFHLRIGTAIAAGHPWLTFLCPACQRIGEIDLRRLDPPSQRDN
jgi:hypothetical protein